MLDASWLGASTLPSRTAYPHQWNWDSAFIAIGRSWYDQARAERGLRSLFAAHGRTAKSSIMSNPSVGEDAYFPGPAFWQTSTRSADAPRDRHPSGITQPAIHARAALEMHRHAHDAEASPGVPQRWIQVSALVRARLLDRFGGPGRHRPAVIVHPTGIGPGQLTGLGPRPERDGDPCGGGAAVRPARPRPWRPGKDRPTNAAYDRFVYLAAATGTPGMTTRGSQRRCPSSWQAHCSPRSSCGPRRRSPRSRRSSVKIPPRIARQRGCSRQRCWMSYGIRGRRSARWTSSVV